MYEANVYKINMRLIYDKSTANLLQIALVDFDFKTLDVRIGAVGRAPLDRCCHRENHSTANVFPDIITNALCIRD